MARTMAGVTAGPCGRQGGDKGAEGTATVSARGEAGYGRGQDDGTGRGSMLTSGRNRRYFFLVSWRASSDVIGRRGHGGHVRRTGGSKGWARQGDGKGREKR
ncbi:hypothetical protein E2562_027178, partial [Oryza meyeriana var. granulata]